MTAAPEQEQIAARIADEVPRSMRELLRRTRDDYRLVKATKYGLLPLAVIFMLDLVQEIDKRLPVLLLPEIRQEFGVTLTQLVFIQQAFAFLAFGIVPFIGYLADRVRRTVLLGAGAILSGIFSVAAGFSPNILVYQALRTFDGAGDSISNVPTQSLLLDYYPIEARAKGYSLRQLAAALIGLVSTPLVGFAAFRFGWRAAFILSGPLLVVVAVVAMMKLREPVRGYWERLRAGEDEESANIPQPRVSFGEGIRTLLAIKTLRRMAFVLPLLSIGRTGFELLFAFYLVEQFRLNPFERSLLQVPASIVGLVALLFGGVVADTLLKKRAGRVLVFNGLVNVATALAQVLVVFVPNLALLVVMRVVISIFDRVLDPAVYAATSLVLPPRMRGQALGALTLLFLPTIPFATLPAYIADRYGVRTGLMLYAPLYLLAAAIVASAARFYSFDQRAAIAAANATNEYNRAKAEGRIKLLLVRDVDVEYNGVQVLFNVDLDVDEGEMIALLGTNGAGKSTLLRAISGIQEASAGAIFYNGEDITHRPPYEIPRLGIVHMPGGRAVFGGLSVRDNLELARLESADDGEGESAARLERVFEFFPELRDTLDRPAGLLSGGEQQMVGLAQAFLCRPRLLMIDELSLGLSPVVVTRLLGIVRAINAEGTTVVLVEQSVNVSLTVARRAVFMEKGEIRFDGPIDDLFSRPDIVRSIYLKGAAATVAPRATAPASLDRGRPLLEVERLTKSFGGVNAVDDVSFVVREGEALGLIGPNGAGKTTVFDLVSGYLAPDAGVIRFDGIDITRTSPDERGRLRLVRRFQDAKLFQSLTVFEAICVALDRHLDVRNVFVTALQLGSVRRSEARIRARADRLIDLLELGSFRDKFVSDLSTGVRRVADLACVLAAEPRLVLLDEPSSGIAQAEAEALGPLLRRIRYETGCSLLLIEHDMNLIARVSDELLALVQGRVITRGPADDVLGHPLVVAAYLGDDDAAIERSGARP